VRASEAARARASPLQANPRPGCRVCRLPAREIALVEGVSRLGFGPRSVAARFGTVSRKDVVRHMSGCVNGQEEKEE
jgi:hypothetical protein